jgi:ABC-type transporter MlaC component
MRHKTISQVLFIFLALPVLLILNTTRTVTAQVPTATPQLSPADKVAVKRFEQRVKDYVKLRSGVKAKLPKLSKDATPQQIETYRNSFEESMRTARAGAKPGDLFNTEGSDFIRRTLKTNFQGRDRVELREIVFDGETPAIKVRVNYPYPEPAALTEMPPTVLLNLPQLPPEVKYRFVGRNLLLLDRDNNVILDYMTNALP